MDKSILLFTVLIGLISFSNKTFHPIATENINLPDKSLDPAESLNILFVGNSLTYYNNLPKLVKTEARSKGVEINTTMLAKAGYAIVDHWAEGEVQKLIKSKTFDFIVIQQGPSSQQAGYDMLLNDGSKYARLCQKNSTKLVYFMVWPSITYFHTFNGVIENYTKASKANNAILIPVGEVWKRHIDETNDYSYYGEDGFHPSQKGSVISAEVIVEYLMNSI